MAQTVCFARSVFLFILVLSSPFVLQGCATVAGKIESVSGDSRTENLRKWVREDPKRKNLLVFVHGFNSSINSAWGDFPNLIQSDDEFSDFNILLYGYRTQ